MFGFYRLAAAVPQVFLADVEANTDEIIRLYTRLVLAMIAVWTMRLWCMIRG